MKLHIGKNQNKTTTNTSAQEVYQLHFHKEITAKTKDTTVAKEIFYTYTEAPQNLDKAFDILFEIMLK